MKHRSGSGRSAAVVALVLLVVAVAVAAFALGRGDQEAPDDTAGTSTPPASSPTSGSSAGPSPSTSPSTNPRKSTRPAPPRSKHPPAAPPVEHVIAISVDALGTRAIEALGAERTPTLHRLLAEGSSTLNARTAFEQNVTLPNHTGMVTGRRIALRSGGHGVTWNTDRAHDTVPAASGPRDIASIFSVAHEHGVETAMYASKAKFDIFVDSWPNTIDTVVYDGDDAALVGLVADRVAADELPGLTFLHLDAPDATAHRRGGMSSAYLDAVADTDTLLERLVTELEDSPVGRRTLVVLTADHGFAPGTRTHTPHRAENYTIPFLVWGPAVGFGDLYAQNPEYADPGTGRPAYDGPQPVRNLLLASVAMRALGLPPVVDNGARPALQWRAAVRLPG